jgi:hypothetical protein
VLAVAVDEEETALLKLIVPGPFCKVHKPVPGAGAFPPRDPLISVLQ